MSDDKLNPHTGQPMPEDPKPATEAPAAPADKPAETSAAGAAAAMGTDGGGSAAPASAESAAPTQQELAIRAALENVMDPEINLSVIDLGLIREIHILEDKTHIRMMLTTPFCPYAPQMVEDVKNAVLPIRAKPVDVELMPDPWSPDLMPDPGLLGYTF